MSDEPKPQSHDPSIAWYETNACNCKTRPHKKECNAAWLNDHYPDREVPVEVVESK